MQQNDNRAAGDELVLAIGTAFDHSAAIAPIMPLTDGLPTSGAISPSVNGDTTQAGDLAQSILSCAEIVANLSTRYRLKAGDLIYTGAHAGVGPLGRGDRILGQAGLPSLSPMIG